MSKAAVVYYSSTGNTEKMAEAVAEAARAKGTETDLISCESFAGNIGDYDAAAFGCPAMGDEVLEETVFEPMFAALEDKLSGKRIGLFGSYGWGDGKWMRDWADRCRSAGAVLINDGVIANNEPDEDALAQCRALGEELA